VAVVDDDALLALAPVAGLAAYCVAHLATCRIAGRRGPYRPLVAGFFAGLAATAAASLAALRHMAPSVADLAALAAMDLAAYLALAFGYFNFINMNVASLRIRMLQEMLAAGGRMSKEQLLSRCEARDLAAVRIARLVRGRHLVEEHGRLHSGGAVRFLWVARIFDALRWIILGKRYVLGPAGHPEAVLPCLATKEGLP
jgi:uncharacterized membrane protein YjjP (DUF1212 family)